MVRYKGIAKDFDNTPRAWQAFALIVTFIVIIVLIWQMLSVAFGYHYCSGEMPLGEDWGRGLWGITTCQS